MQITELRGPQDDEDGLGQWIEIAYAGQGEADLAGLELRIRPLDGEAPSIVPVRGRFPVQPGDRVVIGVERAAADAAPSLPPDADLGTGTDHVGDLPNEAIVELYACGEEVIYRALPEAGTRALDPDAADNGDVDGDAWCDDAREAMRDDALVRPGSPGEENPDCGE